MAPVRCLLVHMLHIPLTGGAQMWYVQSFSLLIRFLWTEVEIRQIDRPSYLRTISIPMIAVFVIFYYQIMVFIILTSCEPERKVFRSSQLSWISTLLLAEHP